MKRIILFLATNMAVILTLIIVTHLLGVNQFITAQGLNYFYLLVFASIIGFGGAFISLLISKHMAKWTMKVRVINGTEDATSAWIYSVVQRQAQQEGIDMPEVGIYTSKEMNAFATGPSKNNALVAVSTGLLEKMTKDEVEAVLGHEVAHISNGDMVTLTLLQGVLNTFVIFISRIIGYAADQITKGQDNTDPSPGWAYYLVSFVFEIFFGILSTLLVASYSRTREFDADIGGARLKSKEAMISALRKLSTQTHTYMPATVKSFGIFGLKNNGILSLFSSHPPINKRIEHLQKLYN